MLSARYVSAARTYASYIAAVLRFCSFTEAAMTSNHLQLGRGVRARGRDRKRVSNRVKRPCKGRDRVLRVSSAEFDLSSPRGNEKPGPRSEACHASEWLCLELLSIILGQVEERFTSLLVAVLMRRSGAIYADRALSKLYT